MSERKLFCNFSIETPIYDVDLPNKILEKLNSLDLHPNPKKVYDLFVYFSDDAWLELELYKFPVQWKQHEIDYLEKIKNDPNERRKTILKGVLNQQIHNICDALETFPFYFATSTISGERFDDINQVYIFIEEKAERRKKNAPTGTLVIPSRMEILTNLKKAFEDIMKRREKAEQKKAEEIAQHTPNMKNVEEIFLALANAILEDRPDKTTSPKTLAREMILQGELVCDWPLEIRGHVKYEAKDNRLLDMDQMDCPKFLVYVKRKSAWTLSKVKNLEDAEYQIICSGYNYKDVEQVVVLHNLKNLKFKLYSRTRYKIEPISKSKAHTAKNLTLGWVKSRK